MATVAGSSDDSTDLKKRLTRMAVTARETIPLTGYASFLIRYSDGHFQTIGATDPALSGADDLQSHLREGPGYDAVTDVEVTHSGDLANDSHWPAYGPRASALGVRSQLAMRVHDEPGVLISLNLYSRDLAAFRHPVEAARVLVDYAGTQLARAGDLNRLRVIMTARQEIFRAVGFLMERYQLDEDLATELLVRLSDAAHLDMPSAAGQIVNTRIQKPTRVSQTGSMTPARLTAASLFPWSLADQQQLRN